jgi:hypothetical protein
MQGTQRLILLLNATVASVVCGVILYKRVWPEQQALGFGPLFAKIDLNRLRLIVPHA